MTKAPARRRIAATQDNRAFCGFILSNISDGTLLGVGEADNYSISGREEGVLNYFSLQPYRSGTERPV